MIADNDTIHCDGCNSNVLKKCVEIHKLACIPKIQQKKKSGLFTGVFRSKRKQKEEEEEFLIPCLECGQSFPFSMYAAHQEQCVGRYLTQCKQCLIKFPTFLFQDHLKVCQGKKEIPVQKVGLQEEEPAADNALYGMISMLATKERVSQNLTDDPLSQEDLKSLKQGKVTVQEDCSVCCCLMLKKNKQIILNCKHVFHKNCITSWLRKNPLCPMCRQHALQH